MAILKAAKIAPPALALSEVIQGFSYEVRLPQKEFISSSREIHRKIEDFLLSSACIITKKTGEKIREKDIRPFVEGLTFCEDSFSLQLQIKLLDNGTLNPSDLLQNILPVPEGKVRELHITKTDTRLKAGS
jgi:hypothetical protein